MIFSGNKIVQTYSLNDNKDWGKAWSEQGRQRGKVFITSYVINTVKKIYILKWFFLKIDLIVLILIELLLVFYLIIIMKWSNSHKNPISLGITEVL